MEPMTLILNTIALGLKAGVERVTGDVVGDLFQGLLSKIRTRLRDNLSPTNAAETEQMLMKAVDKTQHVALCKRLGGAGVDDDQEIIEIARQVMNKINEASGNSGASVAARDINVSVSNSAITGDISGITIKHN